jgi:hypothetical protein
MATATRKRKREDDNGATATDKRQRTNDGGATERPTATDKGDGGASSLDAERSRIDFPVALAVKRWTLMPPHDPFEDRRTLGDMLASETFMGLCPTEEPAPPAELQFIRAGTDDRLWVRETALAYAKQHQKSIAVLQTLWNQHAEMDGGAISMTRDPIYRVRKFYVLPTGEVINLYKK